MFAQYTQSYTAYSAQLPLRPAGESESRREMRKGTDPMITVRLWIVKVQVERLYVSQSSSYVQGLSSGLKLCWTRPGAFASCWLGHFCNHATVGYEEWTLVSVDWVPDSLLVCRCRHRSLQVTTRKLHFAACAHGRSLIGPTLV